MTTDDRPVGRVLSRREALGLLSAISAATLAACAPGQAATQPLAGTAAAQIPTPTAGALPTTAASGVPAATATAANAAGLPACVVRPAQTEGPYFVDEKLNRTDIRTDPSDGSVKDGAPLQLTINVSQLSGSACTPLAGTAVDIWHCDAQGLYSDVTDRSFNTVGKKFLRGYQVTNLDGAVRFTTIYPGWYQGRTVHIHFKIRTDPGSASGAEFTSQLYFDDSLSDQVFAQAPYASKGQRGTRNADDAIYAQGGDQLLLQVTQTDQGYAAVFDIGLLSG